MSNKKFNLIAVVESRIGDRRVYTVIYSDGKGCIPSTFIDCDLPKTVRDFMASYDSQQRIVDGVCVWYRRR